MSGAVVIGPGRAGLALAYALRQADAVSQVTVCGRRPEPPAHPLFIQGLGEYVYGLLAPRPGTQAVFLAVPDGALVEMAHSFAGQGPPPEGCAAFHLSGALGVDVLAPLHEVGYAVGSFHPLQAFANGVTGAERLPGSAVAVSGQPEALRVARSLAAALGCRVLTVPEQWRPLYHAAAVVASNYLPALLDAAARMLERAGVDHDDALPALLPLVEGTLANIRELGLPQSVTGPLARGDLETIDLHLRALEGEDRRRYALFARELARLLAGVMDDDAREAILERLKREEG